jgi:hypothetical protein
MLLLDPRKRMRANFELIDLQQYNKDNVAGNPELWITQGLEPGAHGLDPTEFFL